MKKIEPLVRNGKSGDWWIDEYEVTESEAQFWNMRALMNHRRQDVVEAGKYVRLMRGGTVVMSNTQMEMLTCSPILKNGKGRVLNKWPWPWISGDLVA